MTYLSEILPLFSILYNLVLLFSVMGIGFRIISETLTGVFYCINFISVFIFVSLPQTSNPV